MVVKPEFEQIAQSIFEGTQIKIITGGTRHLGAVIGSKESRDDYVMDKVRAWCDEVDLLADIAATQPHAVYSALVHGLFSRWQFITRTIPDISNLLSPLEDKLHQFLIPALTDRPSSSEVERDILALPAHLGGLGIPNPSTLSQSSFHSSVTLTAPLVRLIMAQDPCSSTTYEDINSITEAKKNIRTSNRL